MFISSHFRIWLARHRVDFRKGASGLLAECYKMGLDPFKGDLVLFIGRNRRRIKLIHADSTGIWVSAKVFTMEAIKTNFKFLQDPLSDKITQAELSMIMEGSSFIVKKRVATFEKTF